MTDRPRYPEDDREPSARGEEPSSTDGRPSSPSEHADGLTPGEMELLRRAEAWLVSSRTRAPEDLAETVLRRIEEDSKAGAAPSAPRFRFPPDSRRWLRWNRLRWALVPAVAAAALAGLLLLRGGPIESPEAAESRLVRWRFQLDAGSANQVCLVGSFNRWSVCRTPLQLQPDGTWAVTVDLPSGRHEYMYVVDGRWMTDPSAALRIDDGFGNENAVLLL